MNDGTRRAPVRVCPNCGKRADLMRNPYFGVSLAVHEYLVICGYCGFFKYVRGIRSEEDDPAPAPPPRRWLGRMGRAVFRRHSKDG
jgi:ribosomal protein S27AE